MSYHRTLGRLADDVQAKVLTVYEAWQEGAINQDQFVQLVAAHIATGNSRAVALADLSLATALSIELGAAQPTVGLTPPDDVDRLREGALTLALAAGTVDITARLVRFATGETFSTALRAWGWGMQNTPVVVGWYRRLEADACDLCKDWAADGLVYDKDAPMFHHVGCQCTPQPVLETLES